MDMMIPWWYHANTTAFGICWLLFIVVACFHSLTVSLPSAPCDLTKWFYLCRSTANQKAGLFRSLSQSLCQHPCFFSLAWASTFTEINVCSYYIVTWNCTQIASATSNTLGKQSLMPSMFRASPWEVIPLEAFFGVVLRQRGIESQWGLLWVSGWSADVEFPFYKIHKTTRQIQVVG